MGRDTKMGRYIKKKRKTDITIRVVDGFYLYFSRLTVVVEYLPRRTNFCDLLKEELWNLFVLSSGRTLAEIYDRSSWINGF